MTYREEAFNMMKLRMWKPERPFGDDPGQILKAVMLHATTGCGIEGRTMGKMMGIIRQHGHEVFGDSRMVPMDVIRDSLERILMGRHAVDGLHLLRHLELLSIVLPELDEMVSMTTVGHKDVWNHTISVLRNGFDLPDDVVAEIHRLSGVMRIDSGILLNRITARLRWALLLHDIGKARTRTYGAYTCPHCRVDVTITELPGQCDRCYGLLPLALHGQRLFFRDHEEMGETMARELMTRLGYDTQMVEWVSRDVGLHGFDRGDQHVVLTHRRQGKNEKHGTRRRRDRAPVEEIVARLRDGDDEWANLNEMLRWHLIISDATGRPVEQMEVIEAVRTKAAEARAARQQHTIDALLNTPLLTGDELKDMFALPPGIWIGVAHDLMRKDRRENPEGHDRVRAKKIAQAVVDAFENIPPEVRREGQRAWLMENASI